ncbi:glycoside hydrolase family 9 protein [uncultured Fibrobacter sp.]|uniref:glycoside hydrolase family 9 protein n=1 Tax=uncultured Fibrobacter sp. TaxID=261512 RepID=UPI0025E188EC|nr:glycoside hydrolase family 9 protein [uncultured Fibrobacter sp.]
MKHLFAIAFLLCLFVSQTISAEALPNIDRTCKNCERRYLDSLNVYNRRPIRLNQAGFRPQDYKYAYVADFPVGTKFSVIDANSGTEAFSGVTTNIGQAVKPNIWINGAFKSTASIYEFGSQDSISNKTELLTRAEFTQLSKQGEYFLVINKDTSATFHIHPNIYNAILENALQFFGVQRCGDTKSHFHGPCHLKDGSAVGHDLSGGWHDCGDHFKVSETLGYTAYVLSMVYLVYEDKAEDRYGESYADTVFTDGIPDILYEAKIGTDYLLKLYKASKEDGLIDKGDMYHSVGVGTEDHQYWDLPERQEKQSFEKGGPDREVARGIGTNTAGIFAAAMANVAKGFEILKPDYHDELLEAAKDIYAKIVAPTFLNGNGCSVGGGKSTDGLKGFYPGAGVCFDDAAAAALALWYATGESKYADDLFRDTKINNNKNAVDNLEYFKSGYLGNNYGFHPGGWATDYENVHAYVLFALQKLILSKEDVARSLGLSDIERDSLSMRVMASFRKLINDSTNDGDSLVLTNPGIPQGTPHEGATKLHVITPYNLVWTSFDWGVIRYNLGTANAIFLMYELTGDERYLRVALDNMYYALGANPWDISFLLGAGEKNPQHPHNRAANPDGYNAGGMPYEYKCPKGALMGGRAPNLTLIEDWEKYTSTETCVDFSAQFLFPAQSLANTLPPDNEGPLFSNIIGTPISETEAIISWNTNEVALTTVFYALQPNSTELMGEQQTEPTKDGSLTLKDLTPGATYYFYLEGVDTKRNPAKDDNHGQWYSFTMTLEPITISGVTICQVDHRSAKIYWWSSSRANGVVNYGTSSGSPTESQVASGGAVLFHEAELTGLKSGTTYYFTVSSGATKSTEYSFTTEAHDVYADLDIIIKPSSYQTPCNNWKDCQQFIISITNNDTIPFEDFEMRFYVNQDSLTPVTYIAQKYGGGGIVNGSSSISYDKPQSDGMGGYYLPIKVNGQLEVSGRIVFQLKLTTTNFGELEGSWSLRAHTDPTDPVYFKGVDLKQGPAFVENESEFIERDISGQKVAAFVKDPYIAVYYHGKHIYGYGPNDNDDGPQVRRNVKLAFDQPFVTPYVSIEKDDPFTTYSATARVSPTGLLDDVEKNGESISIVPLVMGRTDAVAFQIDTTLAYGNNYIEWVAWHNHFANKNNTNKYDCACDVVRSNVEIDTITEPPEQRYLEFNLDTINVYTGRFAEVHLVLKDSLKQQMSSENMSVMLTSDNPLVQFFTSTTATIPTTTIDIVNGEAVFYVKADSALTAPIHAMANSTKFVAYENAKAILIVEDLPPWPIITVAKMIDRNCDNVPDAMAITLSNAYMENTKFSMIRFTYGSDTLTSDKVESLNGTELVVNIDLKDTRANTAPSGSITLVSTVEGSPKESNDFYGDGISPTLLSVSVLERLDTATADRVYLQFSEPISVPSLEWPLQLYNGNNPVPTPINVSNARIYNDSLNVWEFTVSFAQDGSSIVKEGMGGQLLLTSSIIDKAGNGVGTCKQPIHTITLKILPVPMTYAYIGDKNEDGLAEYVEATFASPVDDRHKPDSISIEFGSAYPETLWTSSYTFSDDRKTAILNLKEPFRLGNTNGNYSGAYNGKELVGAGLVMQHLGSGAAYETNNVIAEDKVGPVFTSAIIKSTSEFEKLNIYVSEPLAIADTAYKLYLRERGEASVFSYDLMRWNLAKQNAALDVYFSNESEKAVIEGDRIRLAPLNEGAFMDKSGNRPVTGNPWVTVSGDGKPKVKYNVNLQSPVVTIDPKKVSPPVPGNSDFRIYVYNPTTHKLDAIQNGKVVASIDTTVTPLQGAIWTIDMTIPRGAAFDEAPAWDTMSVKYRIPIYTNLGSFVNIIEGGYQITPNTYLSSDNKVTIFVEWATLDGKGVRSQKGRIAGTGAYIYKLEIENRFTPNQNTDEETQKRFKFKSSYEKTKKFGLKRIK